MMPPFSTPQRTNNAVNGSILSSNPTLAIHQSDQHAPPSSSSYQQPFPTTQRGGSSMSLLSSFSTPALQAGLLTPRTSTRPAGVLSGSVSSQFQLSSVNTTPQHPSPVPLGLSSSQFQPIPLPVQTDSSALPHSQSFARSDHSSPVQSSTTLQIPTADMLIHPSLSAAPPSAHASATLQNQTSQNEKLNQHTGTDLAPSPLSGASSSPHIMRHRALSATGLSGQFTLPIPPPGTFVPTTKHQQPPGTTPIMFPTSLHTNQSQQQQQQQQQRTPLSTPHSLSPPSSLGHRSHHGSFSGSLSSSGLALPLPLAPIMSSVQAGAGNNTTPLQQPNDPARTGSLILAGSPSLGGRRIPRSESFSVSNSSLQTNEIPKISEHVQKPHDGKVETRGEVFVIPSDSTVTTTEAVVPEHIPPHHNDDNISNRHSIASQDISQSLSVTRSSVHPDQISSPDVEIDPKHESNRLSSSKQHRNSSPERSFTVTLLGGSGSGKTRLLECQQNNWHGALNQHMDSHGLQYTILDPTSSTKSSSNVDKHNKTCMLHIYDISDDILTSSELDQLISRSDLILIVFSMASEKSFAKVQEYYDLIYPKNVRTSIPDKSTLHDEEYKENRDRSTQQKSTLAPPPHNTTQNEKHTDSLSLSHSNLPCRFILVANQCDVPHPQVPVDTIRDFSTQHDCAYIQTSTVTGFNVQRLFATCHTLGLAMTKTTQRHRRRRSHGTHDEETKTDSYQDEISHHHSETHRNSFSSGAIATDMDAVVAAAAAAGMADHFSTQRQDPSLPNPDEGEENDSSCFHNASYCSIM